MPASLASPEFAARVDLNRDGVIDFRDVRVLEELYGLGNALSSRMEMTERTGTVPRERSKSPAGGR